MVGFATYFVVKSVVSVSIERQAETTIDIFTKSIRNDVLIGLDHLVFTKCKVLKKNSFIKSIRVVGINNHDICNMTDTSSPPDFSRLSELYFQTGGPKKAGYVHIGFGNNILGRLVINFSLILLLSLATLLFGYWFLSVYFMKRETAPFTQLASMLNISDIKKLENCRSSFHGDLSREFEQFCEGVENLASNWTAYQKELVHNERLSAAHETSLLLAHDIKGPLGAIRTASQFLVQKPEEARKLLKKAHSRIEKLLLRIVERKNIEPEKPHFSEIRLENFFASLREGILSIYGQADGIDILFETPKSISLNPVNLDVELVDRAVHNLVKNSIEELSGRGGQVEVKLTCADRDFSICVKDNGSGISPDKLSNLGAGRIQSEKVGGSGLGLFQVRKAVEIQGGEFIASSSETGTQFELKFKYVPD